jgi:methionine--tRNA ligase beta chain
MVSFEDFKKLEIKIGKVISAERIPNSDKLVKLMFDIGEAGPRQILVGIAEFFPDLSALIGKEVPIILNLEPRTMAGEVSNGMMLAADTEGRPILLHPAEEVPPGSIVR